MRIGFKLSQFIATDLFLGFSIRNWDPRINYFLLGKRYTYNFFNVNLTYLFLKKAVFILNNILAKNGTLWVVAENFATLNKLSSFYAYLKNEKIFKFGDWPNGLLTNYKHIDKYSVFPHAVFLLNLAHNTYAGNEAMVIGVPVLSLIDSCENPRGSFYPIPSNSKSLSSAIFYLLLIFRLLIKNRIEAMRTYKLLIRARRKFNILPYLSSLGLLTK
jgi:ribosomal protein S2